MVTSINSSLASALFGGTSGDSFGLSADLLVSIAKARAGVGVDTAALTQDQNAPLAPVWTPGLSPSSAALVNRALTNKSFFDTTSKLYSDLGATGDYTRLFTLYSGLTTLQALAGYSEDETLSKADLAKAQAQFSRGLTELEQFFSQEQFEDIRLAQGDRVDATQSTLAMPGKSEDYVTGLIHRGGLYDKITGLASDAKFNIVATSSTGNVRNVAIDLAQMGSIPRTLSNVVSHINGKLSAAGAATRLEAVDQTPKTNKLVIGGRVIETRYTGPKQYALKVDVRAGEKVAFNPVNPNPAFYAVGTTASGARLIKLEDVGDAAGQPTWLDRPGSTANPIGANVGSGWLGVGGSYTSVPSNAGEQRTTTLMGAGETNSFEKAFRAAGEAVMKFELADGRTISVSTGWRSDDLENWRMRAGESEDRGMLDDVAERLTQLLHEQGVAAGVEVWEDNGNLGFSVFGGDGVRASSLSIGGKSAALNTVEQPGMVGGLRDGVFARRYEVGAVAATSDLFIGEQSFVITTNSGTTTIKIDGGEGGITSSQLVAQLNDKLREKGINASADLVDDGGSLSLRFDTLHDVIGVSATVNDDTLQTVRQAPGAWVNGGLPATSAGQAYGDAIRQYAAAGAPLQTHSGALDIQVVVATATGNKTISVVISAQDRIDNPDLGPGQWNAALQARLDDALNAAGVYVGANSGDLTQWSVAESAGQRLVSVTINGDALSLQPAAGASGLGGAHSVERSFTSAQAATGVSDDVAALLSDQTVSITLNTAWGERTISATLEPGDPRTLESAALRLNEALAAQGYDAGVVATALDDGGAGLRVVTGASHTVRGVKDLSLGGVSHATTLDPIDAVSHADDLGAPRLAERASRGSAVTETVPAVSTFTAPSANTAGWFPGRAFDVQIGNGLKVATARGVATGPDGAVYVLADLSGDSATSAIKGARDVALLKYDSAGKLAFTQMLGASDSASGFALAVSADGKVAVAGSVEGALSSTTAKGKADSFVTVYEADGSELWTARRGASANDEALAIQFAPNGSLVVTGRTESALGGQIALGQSDAYVRGYSATGGELFTKQFGTGRDDAATALMVRDDGSGGMEIFTGGVEDQRGVVRRFTYSAANGFAAGATRDIGYFHDGAINAIAADGAALYVGGEVGADRLTLGAPARGAVAGKDGFVARLDAGLVSNTLDRASYLGSAQDDAVKSLAIVNGDVYAAGVSGGVLAGSGGANAKQGFLARLDVTGDLDWTRTFTSSAGAMTMTGLAVDTSGASALDILGLPRGVVGSAQSAPLVDRSALRVGDEFRIGADGRRLTTIRITDKDTLSTLVTTINRAIGGAGRAEIVRADGVERIKITARDGEALRIDAGRDGRNALSALGLAQGVVTKNGTGRQAIKTYGLGLIAADLKLDSKESTTRTKAELSAAISIVRQAYETLLNPNAKELTDEEKALAARRQAAGIESGYYTERLASYQAALARLGG